jgi:tRNA1(Val) A37 N6-methylase TrmN6
VTEWLVPFATGVVAGLAAGMALAGLILMDEKPHPWIMIVRVQPLLYERLRKAAKLNSTSVSNEIKERLEGSFER